MSDWNKTEDKLPSDGEIVSIKSMARYRYYKESSQQAKDGIQGRWQEFNGYGWSNMDSIPTEWKND